MNGHLVAKNIIALSSQRRQLLCYPKGVSGPALTPKIYAISLGKYDGVVVFNWLTISGIVAAVIKWLLEWTKVAAVKNSVIGCAFWKVADYMSEFLGNTLLHPSSRDVRVGANDPNIV